MVNPQPTTENRGHNIENCPIDFKVCYPSCFFWQDGECNYSIIIEKHREDYWKHQNAGAPDATDR